MTLLPAVGDIAASCSQNWYQLLATLSPDVGDNKKQLLATVTQTGGNIGAVRDIGNSSYQYWRQLMVRLPPAVGDIAA